MSAAAFFDVDGTLVESNIVHYYIFLRTRDMHPLLKPFWYAGYAVVCVWYLILDRRDRSKMNRIFYRSYRRFAPSRVRELVGACYANVIQPKIFTQAASGIEHERAQGRRIVLVTGSLDILMQPLMDEFGITDILCPSLIEVEGEDRFTGELDGEPVGGAEKARRIRAFAEREGIDLAASVAYGDSYADLPMLECVGTAEVVSPDVRLAAIARERNWRIHAWGVSQ